MSASAVYRGGMAFGFVEDGEILFTILADGTIERGPGFTTNDEMSLKFWEAVENWKKQNKVDPPTDKPVRHN